MSKKKLIVILISVIMLFTISSLSASAYDSDLADSITANYDVARKLANRSSFYGNCNLATAYQLRALGIYDDSLDFSGSGNLWYKHFKDETKTSGGYNVITISGKNCLYDLVKQYGNEIYNVVYSLGTGGTSGPTHAMLISAIIDGNVYFADSFGCTYDRTYYPEGTCTVLPLQRFVEAYTRMNGDAYGCVYFSKTLPSEHIQGSATRPDDWQNENKVYFAGEYIITASMLRIREQPNTTSKSLGLIPHGTKVLVTAIKDNWGEVEYGGETGWICLDYAHELSGSDFGVTSLTASSPAVVNGTKVIWEAVAKGGTGKYFYSFYIYLDGKKIYSGTYQAMNSVEYMVDKKGTYQATVTVTDEADNKVTFYGDKVIGVGDEKDLLYGDADGNGKISASDARKILRMSAHMETLVGKNFVCADIDKNGKITSADARLALRKSAGIREEKK